MPLALSAGQHALELLDKGLPSLGVGPSQQLLGLLPGQLAAVQSSPARLATAPQAGARAGPRPGGATSSAALDPPLLWGGWPPCAGPRRPPRRARLRAVGKKGTATARAAGSERVGALGIVGV